MEVVVFDPINCMVRCTTCANTCPANAIGFPPLQDVLDLETRVLVHHAIEDNLTSRREQLQVPDLLPHPDRVIELEVTKIVDATLTTQLLTPRRCAARVVSASSSRVSTSRCRSPARPG